MYKQGDRYRVVSDQVVGLPHGTIVTIEGDQPDNDTLIRTRRAGSSAFFVLFADDIEPMPDDELNDFLDAAERSSDMLASVQTEAEDSGIVHDYRDVIDGIQHFFDARPDVRRSFDLSSNVDEMLIAYTARLESDLAKIHAALRPFIAGGSEYSGVSGDLRAIKEIGERGNRATERSLRLTGEMKTLKTEVARLEEENRALRAANRRAEKAEDALYEILRTSEAALQTYTATEIVNGVGGSGLAYIHRIARQALEV